MDEKAHDAQSDNYGEKGMRACLCWNCGKVNRCAKPFPNGRPRRRSECLEYIDAPSEPKRITHREMANSLGCTAKKIEKLVSSAKGIRFLIKALSRKGIIITYDIKHNHIYFYKETSTDE